MPRPPLARRCLAEAIATFALVFAGCGAIVVDAVRDAGLGSNGIALAFGLVIMVMVYATGHLSGAHINPAVTAAFCASRHFPVREAAFYVPSQLLGAAAGALLLRIAWDGTPAHLGATLPTVGGGSALAYEATMTAFLMFVIMAVATDTRAVGAPAAIAMAEPVALDALFGGAVTGASMNPAPLVRPCARLERMAGLLDLRRRSTHRRDDRCWRLRADAWACATADLQVDRSTMASVEPRALGLRSCGSEPR